jgi:hypothetical protein
MYHPSIFRSSQGHTRNRDSNLALPNHKSEALRCLGVAHQVLVPSQTASQLIQQHAEIVSSLYQDDVFHILPHSAFSLRCFPMQVTKYRYSATQLKDSILNAAHHCFNNLRRSFFDRDKWFPLFSHVSAVALGLPRFLLEAYRANKMAGQWTCMLSSRLRMCGVIPPTPQACIVYA